MVCGSGGEITNLDQDQIGDYQINNPAFCAGRFSSLVFQAVLFGGLKKSIDKKLGVKKPAIIDPDCIASATTNPLLAFVFGIRVEACPQVQSSVFNIQKSESPVWKNTKSFRDQIKTNSLSGSKKRFYQWDYTHNDIEFYDSNGLHLGSLDPITGEVYKGPVVGRKINVK
jgi:hypothetical protein